MNTCKQISIQLFRSYRCKSALFENTPTFASQIDTFKEDFIQKKVARLLEGCGISTMINDHGSNEYF